MSVKTANKTHLVMDHLQLKEQFLQIMSQLFNLNAFFITPSMYDVKHTTTEDYIFWDLMPYSLADIY
jgi:hypothetical protein